MTEFGKRLKELRTEKGISQHHLGLEIKSCQSVISDWENGNAEPTASIIVAVADYFGVSADYLLGVTEFRGNAERLHEKVTTDYTVADFLDTLFEVDAKDRESVMLYALFLKARKEQKRESGKR